MGQSLYGTKFIRDKVYSGTKFIQGQGLYGDKVYSGTEVIRDKVYIILQRQRKATSTILILFHSMA